MKYEEEEFQAAKRDILDFLYGNVSAASNPKAALVCAQPGAGKTELVSHLFPHTAFINGDEYRRYFPNYRELFIKHGETMAEETREFSGRMTEELIDALSARHANLVIEGTLRTIEVPERTRQLLESRGYGVELDIFVVHPLISYLRTLKRYAEMEDAGTVPRKTPKEHHDYVAFHLVQNVDTLYRRKSFSDIRLFKEEGNDIREFYSFAEMSDINPADLIRVEFSRKFTQKEIQRLEMDYGQYAGKEWRELKANLP